QQILDYFGDEGTIDNEKCRCDVCAEGGAVGGGDDIALPQADEETTTLIRQLLAGVARLNERAGVGTVAEVLAGSESEKMTSRGYEQLSVYGLLRLYKAKQIIAMLHRLIEAGLVQQTSERGSMYKLVRLTAAGVNVMKSEAAPPAPLADLMPRRSRSRSYETGSRTYKSSGDTTAAPLDADGQQRLAALKKVRASLAREASLPAYCVANDRTLRAIAADCPADAAALERVKGMGPRRVASYGEALLAALQEDGTSTDDDVGELRYVADATSEWPSHTD
ncbi:MAG: RQC domain-containing protein, partial [Planctomycetota bacterium]